MRGVSLTVVIALVAALMSGTAAAQSAAPPAASAWATSDHGAVRLVAASPAVGAKEQATLGLQFRMADGWKVYWRSPGDAGYPPSIDWSGSFNLAAAAMAWPVPARFSVLGLETLGYSREVVLPITATLETAGEAVRLRAAVDYLTCAEICVPVVADLTLDLPAGPTAPSAHSHLIGRYAAQVPSDGAGHGLTIVSAAAGGSPQAPSLHVLARADASFAAPDVFVEGPDGVVFGRPDVSLADDGRRATLTLPVQNADLLEGPLTGTEVTVTLVDGPRAAERLMTVAAAGTVPEIAQTASMGLLAVLGLAVLGGLILNLMPCVLPVLSIKLLGVVGHGGGDRRVVRLSFLASAAGIVASFLVLAGALIALQAGGMAIGWGIQFQQPWFLTAMTLLVVVFACNLWGLFEVPLPAVIADAGVHAGHVRGLGGHFLTGALATLLATPCSAPFLGTAVGFALSRGAADILAVFLALGIGLALPYLAVAAAPRVATMLPRPGPWMATLKRVLALALVGTGVWLVTVLATAAGSGTAIVVGALSAALIAVLAGRQRLADRWRPAGLALAVGLAVAAFLMPAGADQEPVRGGHAEHWQAFDPSSIPALVASGQVVFVNVTAEWCITCRVNETLVLNAGDVGERLAAEGVVAMRGDWTRPDDAIARYLASFGRYGIPFDAVYGPGIPDGEALPELLTHEVVLSAMDRARGS